MNTRGNQTILHDIFGEEYVVDADGNRQKPITCPKDEDGNYNTPGYCGLCGRMDCRGGCFK